jgi:DNA-binding LacI/PurR family transcriptional regulator
VDISGYVAPGFGRVAEEFQRNFTQRGDLGAGFVVIRDDEPLVDLWGGIADRAGRRPWTADTLQILFSGTKGLVAACILMLIERGQLVLDTPVARYWPEFAAAGKGQVLVRDFVSHTVALPGLEVPVTWQEATDARRMAALLARQPRSRDPRASRTYHAVTFGWLCGELVRRVDGRDIGQFFAEEIALPRGNADRERECVEALLKRRVDGIVFTTAVHGKNVQLALDAGVHAVEIEQRLCDAASAIVVDNYAAATKAVRHLLNLGHQKIGFLAEPFLHGTADITVGIPKDRFNAYRDALRTAGHTIDESHIVLGHYPREQGGWGGMRTGATYMRRLLSQAPDLTAVFAVSDLVAAGAVQALYAKGIQIPQQMSIIGFDDTFARYLAPPLTTIRQPMFDMGYKAASLAINLITEDVSNSSAEFCPTRPHRAANDSTSSRRSERRARLKVHSCFLRTAGGWVTTTSHAAHVAAPQRYSEAILAPSAWERNLAQVTVGTTVSIPAIVPNPQSVPAITLSRPTTSA